MRTDAEGRARRRRRVSLLASVAAATLLAGCGMVGTGPASDQSRAAGAAANGRDSLLPASDRPPAAAGLVWRPVGSRVSGVPITWEASRAAGRISLLWMDSARLRFRFVPGTQVPERSPSLPADDQPSTWVPSMVAAFNGGFWLKDGSGGYRYDGTTVAPLRDGFASLVLTTAGRLSVGVWGSDVSMTSDVAVVRQNLVPMIRGGVVQVNAAQGPASWGRPDKGSWNVNRSALAELADGSLVYEFGYRVTPAEMASGLAGLPARTAMMLDMNGSWPMGFVYTHQPALHGTRVNPHEYHDATIYLTRYRKDFVAVLAP